MNRKTLYTCQSGRELHSFGESFYASEKPNGSHQIAFKVEREFMRANSFTEETGMVYIAEKAELSWL